MIGFPRSWRRAAARVAIGIAAPTLLSLAGESRSAELPPAIVTTAQAGVSELDSFRATALERQPSIAAARASLGAAQARAHSVESIRLGGVLFARDLPVRKQQSALGVQSYEAGVCV